MTQPPKYARQYLVKDNCLFETRNSKQGDYTKKLCNFVPGAIREIMKDDGMRISIQQLSPKRNGSRHRNYSSKMPDPLTATVQRTGIPDCLPVVTVVIPLCP